MFRTAVDYLKITEQKFPQKRAYVDEKRSIDFSTLKNEAMHVAMAICSANIKKKPIAIFLDKSVEMIVSFIGVTYSGNFYSPLDTQMPIQRIEKIVDTLQPAVFITDQAHLEEVKAFSKDAIVLVYEEMQMQEVDIDVVERNYATVIDTDISYILFTSGSTGVPKGVIISHRSLIDFIEWGKEHFQMDDSLVFGNQVPFYFSMSVFDIYQTLRNGATMYIIPKEHFMAPTHLMSFLDENKINTLFWVPSALTIPATLRALNTPHLNELRNVFFGGESMTVKVLNRWIEEYPDVKFVNFYGPTEVTDTCTIYEVNRAFDAKEALPMGTACANMDVFLLNENDEKVEAMNEIGEVCVRGTGLSYGYYNNELRTQEAFVQNPLNPFYKETIYKTGDLAYINEFGEFVYAGRKDFQIKHMGQRIELGEIETAVSSIEGVEMNCCLYDTKRSRIVLFYSGNISDEQIQQELKDMLPVYMIPNRRVYLEEMPMNLNGKIDRQRLKELL